MTEKETVDVYVGFGVRTQGWHVTGYVGYSVVFSIYTCSTISLHFIDNIYTFLM